MAAAEDDYNDDYYGYKVLVSMFIPNSLLYAFVVPNVLLHVFVCCTVITLSQPYFTCVYNHKPPPLHKHNNMYKIFLCIFLVDRRRLQQMDS